jgi:hypothetical protein
MTPPPRAPPPAASPAAGPHFGGPPGCPAAAAAGAASPALRRLLQDLEPGPTDAARRLAVHRAVAGAVASAWPAEAGAALQAFGSSGSGLWAKGSDLDLCLLVPPAACPAEFEAAAAAAAASAADPASGRPAGEERCAPEWRSIGIVCIRGVGGAGGWNVGPPS